MGKISNNKVVFLFDENVPKARTQYPIGLVKYVFSMINSYTSLNESEAELIFFGGKKESICIWLYNLISD